MNLIILTNADAIDDNRFRLTDHRAEHIRLVLRLKPGDTVEIGLLNGPQGTARIEQTTDDQVTLTCESLAAKPVPMPAVDLICALPRPQTLKKVLITATSMGVRQLHLIRANRVEKSYFQSPLLEPRNFTPYLIEGLSQGKLTRLSEVQIHSRFRPFFEDTLSTLEKQAASVRLLPDPEATVGLESVYDGKKGASLLLAIGPEGGWVPFETELMESVGFRRYALGRWILRVETAVAAALAQVELVLQRR